MAWAEAILLMLQVAEEAEHMHWQQPTEGAQEAGQLVADPEETSHEVAQSPWAAEADLPAGLAVDCKGLGASKDWAAVRRVV